MATNEKYLKLGTQGESVSDLQTVLGLRPTGTYDGTTQNAVTKYQRDNGLTVDGVVGDETLGSILGSGEGTPAKEKAQGAMTSAAATQSPAQAYTQADNGNSSTGDYSVDWAGLSDSTRAALSDMISRGYQPSQSVQDAYRTLEDMAGKQPSAFQSQYAAKIDALIEQITNRENFTYDPTQDAAFQRYRDLKQKQGQMAMMDTVAQNAALTGGYGNSWAQTAGQQTYQQNLAQADEMIPQFQNAALAAYQQQGQNMATSLDALDAQRAQEQSEWQQGYNAWAADRDFAKSGYDDAKQYDYDAYNQRLQYLKDAAKQENAAHYEERDYALNLVSAMLSKGNMPSESLLEQAGLSKKDAKKMMTKSHPSGSSSKSTTRSAAMTPVPTPPAASTGTMLNPIAAQAKAKTAYAQWKKSGTLPNWSAYDDESRKLLNSAFNALRMSTK